jgi:tetratricopeptide (TPR) repeat protein
LLAYVRYIQGRLDEALELAEQIALEGHDTGNRWAVGMMNVLLANIALWRGRGEECVQRGREAVKLFRSINDRWAEAQATAPLARALASLGRFKEYAQVLGELTEIAQLLPDQSYRQFVPTIAAAVAAQLGDAEKSLAKVELVTAMEGSDVVNNDRALAYGNALLQNGRVDDACSWLEPAYAMAEDDGPITAIGGLLTLTYAAAGRPEQACRVAEGVEGVSGGTYLDRIWRRWGEGFARLQLGDVEAGLAALDDADAIAAATDSVVDQAMTSLARAIGLDAIGHSHAAAAREDADGRLHTLGIDGAGWERVFQLASRTVPAAR